jgi:hypothetical protein
MWQEQIFRNRSRVKMIYLFVTVGAGEGAIFYHGSFAKVNNWRFIQAAVTDVPCEPTLKKRLSSHGPPECVADSAFSPIRAFGTP